MLDNRLIKENCNALNQKGNHDVREFEISIAKSLEHF